MFLESAPLPVTTIVRFVNERFHFGRARRRMDETECGGEGG
jgi:hypothetical protein